ncbi:hypothetical protein [Nocardia abscessus]|uniref:hypothetical protein n=1 Tax=Nocardia abscessus TaxID=120957 RepID=UPI00245631F3|nr:hypothetical protein [Nocardia abscessus]
MIDTGTGAPTLTPDDILGGKCQVNQILFRIVRNGVHLLYILRIDSHRAQCRFTVDAFHHIDNRWYQLWWIPPQTYTFSRGHKREELIDPQSAVIASPNDGDDNELKAASWQKIVNALSHEALALVGSAEAAASDPATCPHDPTDRRQPAADQRSSIRAIKEFA